MDDNGNQAYLVKGIPWKEAPFELLLVVLTSGGKEAAEKFFKSFYKNEGIEITLCDVVSIVKGEGFVEDVKEQEGECTAVDSMWKSFVSFEMAQIDAASILCT